MCTVGSFITHMWRCIACVKTIQGPSQWQKAISVWYRWYRVLSLSDKKRYQNQNGGQLLGSRPRWVSIQWKPVWTTCSSIAPWLWPRLCTFRFLSVIILIATVHLANGFQQTIANEQARSEVVCISLRRCFDRFYGSLNLTCLEVHPSRCRRVYRHTTEPKHLTKNNQWLSDTGSGTVPSTPGAVSSRKAWRTVTVMARSKSP